jgi:hypothetical protein
MLLIPNAFKPDNILTKDRAALSGGILSMAVLAGVHVE